MNHFKRLDDLPILDLYSELNKLIVEKDLNWGNSNQICLNHIEKDSSNFLFGTGSLTHDWENSYFVVSETGEKKRIIKERDQKIEERDFKYLCNQFKNTLFETVYTALQEKYTLGRVRLMKSESKTCLSWHVDTTPRIHYPIKTQEGCFMVIEDEVMHIPLNEWWETNTILKHTAFNGSKESRIHLVATVL